MTRQSIVSPGTGNTREIEMAAEDHREGKGEMQFLCCDTKIFDAISAVLFEVTEPSRLIVR